MNRPVGNTSTKKKLQYTHGLEIQEEDMVNLEELMLGEDGMDEEVTDVEIDYEEDKDEADDDIEILGARPRESTSKSWVDLLHWDYYHQFSSGITQNSPPSPLLYL